MSWNPEQYLKFVDARRRPALDLLARLGDISPGSIVDLGCGAGNVTQLLAERGVIVARRTVNKYRDRGKMLSSRQRRTA